MTCPLLDDHESGDCVPDSGTYDGYDNSGSCPSATSSEGDAPSPREIALEQVLMVAPSGAKNAGWTTDASARANANANGGAVPDPTAGETTEAVL